jgi:amidase
MVPVAHANDGGGSIRIPASACGLVGLKPSRGRTSLGPDLGEGWAGMSIEHVVTRSVRDTAAILDAVSGRGSCGRAAAALLASLGHEVDESHPDAFDEPETAEAAVIVIASGTARDLAYWSDRTGRSIGRHDVEPITWGIVEMGRELSAVQYVRAVEHLHGFTRRMARWWSDGHDLLLTPTMIEPPPPLGSFAGTPDEPLRGFARAGMFVAHTLPFNITGQPAISLPLHWTADGVPIGVQLVAAYGREDVLIRVAAQLEQAARWADRRPPIWA